MEKKMNENIEEMLNVAEGGGPTISFSYDDGVRHFCVTWRSWILPKNLRTITGNGPTLFEAFDDLYANWKRYMEDKEK